MGQDQVKEGAHVLDVCVDYVGRDGTVDMDELAARFATQVAAPLVLDSTEPAGHGGRPPADRRPRPAQLGQPRGRRGTGLPPRPGLHALQGVRRRGHLPAHRRGGPGPRRRVEAAGRPPHPRPRRRALRPRARRPHLRRPDLPALHRRRRPPQGRHGHHRGHPPDQGRAARGPHHARRVQRVLRPQARRPATSSTRCSCTSASRPASTRPSSTRRGSCRSTGSPTSSARSASTSSTTAGATGGDGTDSEYDPLHRLLDLFADVEATEVVKEDRSGWPVEQRLSQRIIDGEREGLEADLDEALADGTPALLHHQRRAARGHEGRRRALRHRRDAAALRAAVGRDHEDGGRLPRAAHGEGRRRRQGPHRARHGQGRRPRHRQEPRRHHPHQQRLRGAQPRHQDLASPR